LKVTFVGELNVDRLAKALIELADRKKPKERAEQKKQKENAEQEK
jgi:hypothetical protein